MQRPVQRQLEEVVERDSDGAERARKLLAERYRPSRVKMLFVGEAPPVSGRFFYQADSGLYRAVRDTFVVAFPAIQSTCFLDSFRSLGCYLVDLCETPVDHLDKKKRKLMHVQSEASLGDTIRRLQPETIITLVRSVSSNVQNAQNLAGWTGLDVCLRYPGRWQHHKVAFEETLVPILRAKLDGDVDASSDGHTPAVT